MRRLFLGLFAAAMMLSLSGCVLVGFRAPFSPPIGWLYSDYRAPLMTDQSGLILGPKKGVATTQTVLGMVTTGDASLETAAKSAGITKINYADYHLVNILGVIATVEVAVYGE